MQRPSGKLFKHHLTAMPHAHYLLGEFGGLPGYAHYASGGRLAGIDKEIGSGHKEEMEHLVANVSQNLGELTKKMGGGRDFNSETTVNRHIRSQMMLPWTQSAYAGDYPGNFLGCPALDKFFKSAHCHDMYAGFAGVPVFVEPDTDPGLPFDSCYGLDGYLFGKRLHRWSVRSI
jgi:hypothetical protein